MQPRRITLNLVQNAELALQFERRARIAAEKRIEELVSFGGRARVWGRNLWSGVDVETQTDGGELGQDLGANLEGLWSGVVFEDEQQVQDDDLDSAVMLQRAAAASYVKDDLERATGSAGAAVADKACIEMTLPDSPK